VSFNWDWFKKTPQDRSEEKRLWNEIAKDINTWAFDPVNAGCLLTIPSQSDLPRSAMDAKRHRRIWDANDLRNREIAANREIARMMNSEASAISPFRANGGDVGSSSAAAVSISNLTFGTAHFVPIDEDISQAEEAIVQNAANALRESRSLTLVEATAVLQHHGLIDAGAAPLVPKPNKPGQRRYRL